jgi:hypothetical protein
MPDRKNRSNIKRFTKTALIGILFCVLMTSSLCFAEENWMQLVADYAITDIQPYDGGYWFSAGSRGALRYDSVSGTWHRYNKSSGHMNQNHTVNAMKLMHGRIWFATNYGMYSCKPDGGDWQQHILPGDYYANWVRGFDANSTTIWIASFSGLYSYRDGAFSYHDIRVPGHIYSDYVNCISASDSVVWIGTDDGAIRYDTSLPISDAASRSYFGKDNGFNTASQYVCVRAILNTEIGVWFGLDEYTPSSNPDYCLGGLFHKRGDVWEKYDESSGLSAAGIHFIKNECDKIYAGLFHYVNGVDFDGAGLLELDLGDSTITVLDNENWHVGNKHIRAFYVSGNDTLVGTEEGLFVNVQNMKDMTPHTAPDWFMLQNAGNGEVLIGIDPVDLATAYRIYFSRDQVTLDDSLLLHSVNDTIKEFDMDVLYYVQVAGVNDAGTGPRCKDILAVCTTPQANPVLLVQAFSKSTIENSYDYVREHGVPIRQQGYGFDSASDEAVAKSEVVLSDYAMVNWIAGLDGQSLNRNSKNAIGSYLMQGGNLFISGSYIQENLHGSDPDTYFYRTFLKARAKKDNTNIYSVETMSEGIFNGIRDFSFGVSGDALYRVYRPDGFQAVDGAASDLFYADADTAVTGVAAVQYKGNFATSQQEGALVYLGFPFESVHSDSLRFAMMSNVLDFFGFDVTLTALPENSMPRDFILEQNYPNPFNAGTRITFILPEAGHVRLDLFDLSGKKVAKLLDDVCTAGKHDLRVEARDLAAGVYLYKMRFAKRQSIRKMLLLK